MNARSLRPRGFVRFVAVFFGMTLAWACDERGAATTSEAPLTGDGGTLGEPGHVGDRLYGVTVPASYDAASPSPLVLLLHGYQTSAAGQDRYFKISELAQRRNFLVALPEGLKDQLGNQMWNANDTCCNFGGVDVDDVAYLRGVLTDMKARFNVDPKRVFVIGHSNGGFMAHRLACDLSRDIAGIVSLAGAVWTDPSKCQPAEPVAVLQIHGDDDQMISHLGGNIFGGGPPYPSAAATVSTWAEKNGCDPTLLDDGRLDLTSDRDGDETRTARHRCSSGAAELWMIEGGSHAPRLQASAVERIYGFLEAHPKR